jgi:Ca2+-binding RTX toxin-like protein
VPDSAERGKGGSTHAHPNAARDRRSVLDRQTLVVVAPASSAPLCFGREATEVGTGGNDTIIGTAGNDVLVGRGGADRIEGRGGNDRICGNAGRDDLHGETGNDRIDGGNDIDDMDGGGADDIRPRDRATPVRNAPTSCTAGVATIA